jgi:hypothetical protein
MKYCPQCNRQYSEVWLTFCTDDGSLLREDLTPSADPNWDPRIREPRVTDPSEPVTQWLPSDQPPPGRGWIAPDERAPLARPWQPPPPPAQPHARPSPPGTAIASFVFGIFGVMVGLICAVPIPGIVAVILGFLALSQMKNAPHPTGRGLAIAGIVMGAINLAFFVFGILWFLLSLLFG